MPDQSVSDRKAAKSIGPIVNNRNPRNHGDAQA